MNDKILKDRAMGFAMCATAAALCMVSTAAMAAPAAEARTNITSFGYQLTDLDAADGVTSGIYFKGQDPGGIELWVLDQHIHDPAGYNVYGTALVRGGAFDRAGAVLTHPDIDAMASKNGNALAARATYSVEEAAELLAAPHGVPTVTYEHVLTYSRRAFARTDTDGQDQAFQLPFTLSAHTAVTFSAVLQMATSVDVSGLLDSDGFRRARADGALIDIRATGGADLAIYDPAEVWSPSYPTPVDSSGRGTWEQLLIDPLGQVTRNTAGDVPGTYSIEVTFANRTDSSVVRGLGFGLHAETTMYVQSVPEPSALALVLAGIGMVGAVSQLSSMRSRQSKAR